MLTVKKFGAVLDLSIGGYASGVVGLIVALLTILVFPPDLDLQGKKVLRVNQGSQKTSPRLVRSSSPSSMEIETRTFEFF